ncbi:hypothetical protein [Cryptosporangium aurantiacum]|uniref:Lipoprotein LprG n=1 Tax=Cryptosporangium aurantiacum TaxID=134849 RepID=A0A1M7RCX9_9ACTN|nr:hypothetical protein [Cryptosporangium aurantiacum]SHN44064.1 hypothetical protein SAMN05443668_11040 [Cryptosporangium aurantiacum]
MTDEELFALRGLDPARRDAPPAPGSPRYSAILEKAMTTEKAHRSHRSAWIIGAAASVAAVLVTLGFVFSPDQSKPASAAEQVRSAATATGDVDSLRARLTRTSDDGTERGTGEFSGTDATVTMNGPNGTERTTVLGTTLYEVVNGEVRTSRIPAGYVTPFGPAAEAVLLAVLNDGKVTRRGTETVGGQQARRYGIELTPTARQRLAALSPGELAWFELEYPSAVSRIEVWVADDLIRRITVTARDGSSTTEFYDFNAPIKIRPPSGS